MRGRGASRRFVRAPPLSFSLSRSRLPPGAGAPACCVVYNTGLLSCCVARGVAASGGWKNKENGLRGPVCLGVDPLWNGFVNPLTYNTFQVVYGPSRGATMFFQTSHDPSLRCALHAQNEKNACTRGTCAGLTLQYRYQGCSPNCRPLAAPPPTAERPCHCPGRPMGRRPCWARRQAYSHRPRGLTRARPPTHQTRPPPPWQAACPPASPAAAPQRCSPPREWFPCEGTPSPGNPSPAAPQRCCSPPCAMACLAPPAERERE